jgi:hypothetical protein
MKNHKTARTLLIASFVVVLSIALIGISRTTAQLPRARDNAGTDFRTVRDALRRGGLREAAKVKGHYVRDVDPNWDTGLFNIENLTKNSMVVVVGTVVKNRGARLSAADQLIVTDYEVVVDETMKGGPVKGDTITIALVGGSVEFDDGTSAELRTPEFEHVKPGGAYLLFLGESTNGPNEYTLTGGPQGLVEITVDGTLKSHGRPTDPISLETKDPNTGKNKGSFMREVRKAVVKWPGPGKCCS